MRAHPVPRLRPDPLPPRPLMLALASLFTVKLAIPALAHGGPEPPKAARVLDLRDTPLALPEASGLHGRLTNREGAPLAGWVVAARRPWAQEAEAKVRSDKNGRYAFGSLTAGPLMLTLSPARTGAPTGPLPVALFREGEADNRAAARRLDIGGLDPRGLEAWRPAAKPRPLGVTIVSLPAACHAMTGGAGLLVHDRQRAWRIDEEGRIGAAMTIAIDQELVAAVPTGGDGGDTVLLTQDAWHASLSCRDPRNQLRWIRQVPGRSLLLAPGDEGRFWWQTLDGHEHVGHVLDRNGNNPLAVQLPAHATAAGFAAADGIRLPSGAVRLVAAGAQAWHVDLPTPVQRLLPAGKGSCWAVGGAVATRLSPSGSVEACWLLPRPANQATTDAAGRLWLEVGERLVRLDKSRGETFVLAGRGKPAICAMACSTRHLWLLGRDRRTLARLPLE